MRSTKPLFVVSIALAALLCALPSPARAFDTGPHMDMTRDALTAEGFGAASADIAAVNNWFVDYYTNPGKNAYSGHANFWIGLTRLGLRPPENWPQYVVEGARRLHFDAEQGSNIYLGRTAGVEREWDRLINMTQGLLRHSQTDEPEEVLSAIGMSLHAVQDFYTHSNWVENLRPGKFGLGGPSIASLGYGSHPTWFDVPPEVRKSLVGDREVYTGVGDIPRDHGHWRSHQVPSLIGPPKFEEALNKDWPGRPFFQRSYITSYFATRQWVRAMRTWLGDEPLWKRAMSMARTPALARDLEGAIEISRHTGHWQGGGEPCVRFISCGARTGKAGSVSSAKVAVDVYHAGGRTRYRRAFQSLIGAARIYPDNLPDHPDLPSSRAIQAFTRFVKLEVVNYRGMSLGDPVGDADIYANARVQGQPYTSTIINDEDNFDFPRAYAPFTWLRSIPATNRASTPVTSMVVRIETGDRNGAGTDDDVYLRINRRLRFSLDKAAYDDFERGDDDRYSVPIGDATRDGLTVGDIDRAVIEKSSDGSSGAWLLRGMTLIVNGQAIAVDRTIDRWLEKSRRSWTAAGLTRDHRTDDVAGVWLQLREDDWGANDTGDVNDYDRHTSRPVAYRLGTSIRRRVTGGSLLRGRLPMQNGDRAQLTYRLSTLTIIPPPPPVPPTGPPPGPPPDPPPPVSGPAPDLLLSSFNGTEVTVTNQGDVAAGPFRLTVRSASGDTNFEFAGLAVGQSATRAYSRPCEEIRQALADPLNQVGESNEMNNFAEFAYDFC